MLLIFYFPEKKHQQQIASYKYQFCHSHKAWAHSSVAKLRGQKVDPAESGSSSESTGSKKLLFVFVAVAAVLFHYFSNNSFFLRFISQTDLALVSKILGYFGLWSHGGRLYPV